MSDNANGTSAAIDSSAEALKLVICSWKFLGPDNKIDFQAVADELSITSKAAAAKRFERLLKTFDLKPAELLSKGPLAPGAHPTTSQLRPAASKAASASGTPKRKRATKAAAPAVEDKPKRSKTVSADVEEEEQKPVIDDAADKGQQDVAAETSSPGTPCDMMNFKASD